MMVESDSDSRLPGLFEEAAETFEGLAKANGTRIWWARDLMTFLGYTDWPAFKKVINKTISVCALLNIKVLEMFHEENREIDGKMLEDIRLTRSACFMTTFNADPKMCCSA